MLRTILLAGLAAAVAAPAAALERIKYNNPGLTVDLGVGLWAFPLPMDFDRDGDLDLVVTCPDAPYNGTYFFENPGNGKQSTAERKFPVFKPAVRVGPAINYAHVTFPNGQPRVLTPGTEWINFLGGEFKESRKIYPKTSFHPVKIRENQWSSVDYDGDGNQDLIVGVGDWTEYGWDDAYDRNGQWTRGPLHGYVYLLRNEATDASPKYADPVKVQAGGKPVDVFGRPTPNFVDFDGDEDLDLLCGEFLDGFTYFQNTGTRNKPVYSDGRRLTTREGKPLVMDLEMICPVAIDWDGDGDQDLVVGDEDGRVALVEHTGKVVDGMPQFERPRYFQQVADDVKFGALATPVGVDWDGDGDEDIVSGNTAGYVGFIENLGGNPPKFAAPQRLTAGGETLRIMAGYNGSIQGPAEAKWGYTTISVVDWEGDGLLDIVANSIWGKVVWYRNVGSRNAPVLAAAESVRVEWPGQPPKPRWNWWDPKPGELVPQWRTTPVVHDWTGDGLPDLSMLDHEGYLSLFRREKREGRLVLLPGERVFHHAGGKDDGQPMQLNPGLAGKSGRRKLSATDWDGDGKTDLLINGLNATLLKNVSTGDGKIRLQEIGSLHTRKLAGHDTSPTTVDWDRDGIRDVLIGAEDGYLYYMKNPRSANAK